MNATSCPLLNSTHRQASLIQHRHMITPFMNGLVLCCSFSTSSTKCISPLSFCLQPGKKQTALKQQSFEILRNPYLRKYKKKNKIAKKKLHLFNNEAADLKRRKQGRKCKCESTKTYSEMQCRNCKLYGKHLKQFNFTFKQGERMEQKIRQVPLH